MAVIATAEVRVVADTSRFTEDLRRKLRTALNGMGDDFSRSLTQSLNGLGDQIGRIIEREVRRSLPQIERTVNNVGQAAGRDFNNSLQTSIQRNANYDQFFARLFHGTIAEAIEEEAQEASRAFEREFDIEDAAYRKALSAANAMDRAFEQQFAKNFDKYERTFETEFDIEQAAFRKALAAANAMDAAFEQQFAVNFERRGEEAAEALQAGMERKLNFEGMVQDWSRSMIDRRRFARAGQINAEAFEQRFGELISPAARELSDVFREGFFPSQSSSSKRDAQRFVDNLLNNVESETRSRSRRIGDLLRRNIGGGADAASRITQRLGQSLRRLVTSATIGPLQRLGSLFSDFSQEMATSAATGVILIGVLIQLSGLLGPLPATVGVVAAAITTAAFAFRGMGSAFAASTKDAEEFEEAIKDLAPAAQSVVREFRAFRGAFSDLRLDAQQALWSELEGAITRVGNNLGGALRQGIIAASGAMGRLIDGVADFLAESATADTVAATFDALTGILDAAADEMQPLLRGMREIVDEFLPRFQDLEDAIDGIGEGFERWAEAITTPREELDGLSQAMDAFNRAVGFISQVSRIIVNVFRVVDAIFGATADNGVNLLGTIEALTNNLAEMAESTGGQEALAEFFDNLDRIVAQLLPLVGTLLSELGKLSGPVADLFERARPHVERFFRGMGDGIRALLEGGGTDFIVGLFETLADVDWKQLGESVGLFLANLSDALPYLEDIFNFVVDVVDFISTGINVLLFWAEVLSNAFKDGGEVMSDFADGWADFWLGLPGVIWDFFGWVGDAINEGIVNLLALLVGWAIDLYEWWNELWNNMSLELSTFFSGINEGTSLSLTGLTSIFDGWGLDLSGWWDGLLLGLGSRLSGAFGDLESTVSGGTSGLSSIFTGWGGGISSWWSGLWSGIRGSLSSAWKSITSTVSSGVSGVREAVSNLAGFFRSTFNGIVSTVSSAASSVSGYLSDIRSAVSSITNLTSGLSGFSFFADGGIVFGPTRAIVGEAGPEVIIPLTRPERAATLAADSGLLAILAAQAGGAATTPVSPASIPNVEMHVHSGVADAEQVARRAVRLMERRMGPRGLERI